MAGRLFSHERQPVVIVSHQVYRPVNGHPFHKDVDLLEEFPVVVSLGDIAGIVVAPGEVSATNPAAHGMSDG